MGRRSEFTQDIADEICRVVSTCTDGLKKMCGKREHWPDPETIHGWRLSFPNFANQYAHAKCIQADLLAEECIDIADSIENDTTIDPETGKMKCDHEWVARSRLRLDARKWIACKLLPKVYGDKQQVDTTLTINHEDTLKDLA